MTITASCGHTVLSLDDIITCSVADHDKLGYRCVSYMSLCGACYDYHAEEGYILLDEGEENKWLGGCEMRQSDVQREIDSMQEALTFSVSLLRENEDGSADYQLNCSQEVLSAFTRFGIITALKAAIDDAKLLNPELENNE